MNLVLDLDGTLISEFSHWDCVIPRPGLHAFLHEATTLFDQVGIWTAAGEEWAAHVFDTVLKGHLDPVFLWTGDRCTAVADERSLANGISGQWVKQKRLRKVFHRRQWENGAVNKCTVENTLILDNTRETFQSNYGNALFIPTYEQGDDEYFDRLTKYIRTTLMPQFQATGDVRLIQKSAWWISEMPYVSNSSS